MKKDLPALVQKAEVGTKLQVPRTILGKLILNMLRSFLNPKRKPRAVTAKLVLTHHKR